MRERGDFDHWLAFFLDGVTEQAADALVRAERLTDLREQYRVAVRNATRGVANGVVELAIERPILTARIVEERLAVSRPSAISALRVLADLDILVEVAGGPRGELRWRAHEVLAILTDEEV